MEDLGGLPGGGGNCSPFSLAEQITGLLVSKCLSEIRSHSQPQLASKWILAFFIDLLLKSGAYKVANRWRFCLHKINEGRTGERHLIQGEGREKGSVQEGGRGKLKEKGNQNLSLGLGK